MLPRKFEEVDIDFLQALPESGLRETITLEFKREINHKDRMLKEVGAFANTFGGDLVIGVAEEEGEPVAVPGEDPGGLSLDDYQLKLSQQIRSGIEPAVTFDIRSHELESGNYVTQIRVEQSFIGPHRSVRPHLFYERVSTASVEMSMDKLREAFGLVTQLQERAEKYHQERMVNHPVVGQNGDRPVAFVHVVPVMSLRGQVQIAVASFNQNRLIPPPARQHDASRIDHLGHALIFENEIGTSYSHTGRSGMVEGALQITPNDGIPLWVRADDLYLVDFLQDTFDFYTENDVSGPAFLMVSVWNAGGLQRYTDGARGEAMLGRGDGFQGTQLDCDTIYVQSFDQPASEVMQQPLNIIWNGLGAQRCPSYDPDNSWQPIRR